MGGAECHGSLTLSGRVFPLFFHPLLATPETGGDGRRSIAFFLKMQIFFEYFSSPSSPPGKKRKVEGIDQSLLGEKGNGGGGKGKGEEDGSWELEYSSSSLFAQGNGER